MYGALDPGLVICTGHQQIIMSAALGSDMNCRVVTIATGNIYTCSHPILSIPKSEATLHLCKLLFSHNISYLSDDQFVRGF